jgi:hypothetical protein
MSVNYQVNTNTDAAPTYVDLDELFLAGYTPSNTGFKVTNSSYDISEQFAPIGSKVEWKTFTTGMVTPTGLDLVQVFAPKVGVAVTDPYGTGPAPYPATAKTYRFVIGDSIQYTCNVIANFYGDSPNVGSDWSKIDYNGFAGVKYQFNFPNNSISSDNGYPKNTVFVTCVGGGGAGGSAFIASTPSAVIDYGGGGGGGGSRSYGYFQPIAGVNYNLDIGTGGTAVAIGANGTNGGGTSVSYTDSNGVIHIVASANGGYGGAAATINGLGQGGQGGSKTVANIISYTGAAGGQGGQFGPTKSNPHVGEDGNDNDVCPISGTNQRYSGGGCGGDVPYAAWEFGGLGGGGAPCKECGNYGQEYQSMNKTIYYPDTDWANQIPHGGGYPGTGGGGAGGSTDGSGGEYISPGNGGSGLILFVYLTDQS